MFGFGEKKQPKPAPAAPREEKTPELHEIRAKDALERQKAGAILLDVREPFELDVASVKGTLNIPMNQVPDRLAEIPKDREILCMCHHGMRSAGVGSFLLSKGYTKVLNLSGGIAAWSSEVDPSVPQY